MRVVFQSLGWIFAVVAALRAMATGYTAWLVMQDGSVGWYIPVETLIRDHMPFFTWTIDVGEAILPASFLSWILAQPAIIVFGASAVIAAALSYLCFRLARQGL